MTSSPPTIVLETAVATELARVLGVLADFLVTRPAARASLARFAYPGSSSFWTDELLDYLHHTSRDLHTLATSTPKEAP